jgi:hypothetical protein
MSVPQQLSGFNNQLPPRQPIRNITAAYQVTGADYGQTLSCTGATSYTVSLTSAASIGAGFNFTIWNRSTSATTIITIDPNGSETIDGKTTRTIYIGEGLQIICDGSNWQTGSKKTMRAYAENIASGTQATATGSSSVAIGYNAASSQTSSISFGALASSSGSYGSAIGHLAAASGAYSLAIGWSTIASSTSSVAIGFSSQASGLASFALGSSCKSPYEGKYAYACDFISSASDSQYGLTVLHGGTTTATPLILWAGSSGSATANNQVILPDNSAYAFSILVVARQSAAGGTASAAWKIEGLIRRESGVATTTIVGTPTTTVISNVPGWSIAVSADTTNGCLALTATGASATNINWSATVQTSEVTYA